MSLHTDAGEEIKQPEDLYGALDNTRVGDTVELKVRTGRHACYVRHAVKTN